MADKSDTKRSSSHSINSVYLFISSLSSPLCRYVHVLAAFCFPQSILRCNLRLNVSQDSSHC